MAYSSKKLVSVQEGYVPETKGVLRDRVVGAAAGIPIGAEIGPFANGTSLKANIVMPGAAIWAARFHQLDVKYIKMAIEGRVELPNTIMLRTDMTYPGGVLMNDGPVRGENEEVDGVQVKEATAVRLRLSSLAEELTEGEPDGSYSAALAEAENRLIRDEGDSEEDE
ncbi:uncharacterized protein B0I36DRAFT_356604 [Microdochium trichocladiopsis]|uniref:Uncharacterized protein n=1 Tax=Microdochium trichocladiopsis TaxID=1682393 RepID=A0A9P9BEZ4_9PEZI|nr:uncharacterized protein B0I36DRAFT_356604 [Microdochium trichocladiopsis]KAH7009343.1 hypothetical protein B0I36DRAFT_356604 [Microdochium trichocladiopsis]